MHTSLCTSNKGYKMNTVNSEEDDPPRRLGDDIASTSDHNGKAVATKTRSPRAAAAATTASSSSSWLRSKDPRIVRVSRAFGGKDRHSKVCTIRGLRDRRVRLSVPTAIQLYDLQERLGLDQPSKVVDWLLDAAKNEIDELPPLPVSPENFSLINHQTMLNLTPRVKIGAFAWNDHLKEGKKEEGGRDENDEDEQVSTSTSNTNSFLPRLMNTHHQPSFGSYYHFDPSSFQMDHQDHHGLNLVPFPSQILVCPATTQPLFPSMPGGNAEIVEYPRQMINHLHISNSGASQNPSLYSLSQANNHNTTRVPFQFSMTGTTRVLHSESTTSRGSDNQPDRS